MSIEESDGYRSEGGFLWSFSHSSFECFFHHFMEERLRRLRPGKPDQNTRNQNDTAMMQPHDTLPVLTGAS